MDESIIILNVRFALKEDGFTKEQIGELVKCCSLENSFGTENNNSWFYCNLDVTKLPAFFKLVNEDWNYATITNYHEGILDVVVCHSVKVVL